MTCDRCGKVIGATAADPVIATRLGRMHEGCSRDAWDEERAKDQAHAEEVTARRREAGRRAYAARTKDAGEGDPC